MREEREVPPDWVKTPMISPGGILAGIAIGIMVALIAIIIFWPDPLLRLILS